MKIKIIEVTEVFRKGIELKITEVTQVFRKVFEFEISGVTEITDFFRKIFLSLKL